eukprot:evm.model.scf_805.2 EVM.evm.TU.scf_805.2   scf_805:24520-29646(+)
MQEEEPAAARNCSSFDGGNFFNVIPVVVSESALAMAGNDIQFFVDCVPDNGTILFNASTISPNSTIAISKPISLGASEAIERAAFVCPPGGTVFNITSHGASLSNFTFASCTAGGAAVLVKDCKSDETKAVDLIGMEFMSNVRSLDASAVNVSNCSLSVRDSVFVNLVGARGAALQISDNSSVVVSDSTFEGNTAHPVEGVTGSGLGGAVSSVFTNVLSLDAVNFIGNLGKDGGAVFLRMGGSNDPQRSRDPETYTSGGRLSFVGNSARRGGAVLSVTDGSTANLERSSISLDNVSRFDAEGFNGNDDDIFFTGSVFIGNSASQFGGAWYAERTRVGCRNCTFEQNSATASGGTVDMRELSVFHFRNGTLEGNSAMMGGGVFARNSFVDAVGTAFHGNVAEQGGGGLQVSTLSSTVFRLGLVSHLSNVTADNNRANLGAGLYFFVERDPQKTGPTDLRMEVTGSTFLDNRADFAGAALFTNEPDALRVCCACELEKIPFPQKELLAGLRPGVFNVSANSSGLEGLQGQLPEPCPRIWTNNVIDGDAGSQIVGTTAKSTELCIRGPGSPDRVCAEGSAPLTISNHTSGNDLESVTVRLVDSFGKTAAKEEGLQVRVEAPNGSDISLSGQVLKDMESVTVLEDIGMQAPVGTERNLKLQFEFGLEFNDGTLPDRDIRVMVRPCVPGQVPENSGNICTECNDGSYNFGNTTCLECPTNAKCSGSTVTPLDAFWHSTSKSTKLHECIRDQACSFEKRIDELVATASAAHAAGSALNFSDGGAYPQCSQGYHGVLCGACDATHGKVRSGECIKCQGRARNIFFATSLAVWLFIVVNVLVRNVLTAIPKDRVEKSAPPSPPQRLPSGALSGVEQGASPPNGATDIRPGSSDGSLATDLLRDRNYSADILKILVNFLQVTGVAVFIDARWTTAVSRALGIVDGAAAGGEGLFALECAFSGDSSVPRSVQMFFITLLFPTMVQAVLMAMWVVITAVRSKPASYLIRRWHVSALVVFYFFYIQITRNMVVVFDCQIADGDGEPEKYAIARDRYWVQDTDRVCWRGSHLALTLALAIPVLLFVTVGFPFALVVSLTHNEKKLETTECVRTQGFLYWSYRPGSRYWEVVIMARKALVACISVFDFSFRANLQATLAVGVLAAATVAHLQVRPFVTWDRAPNLHNMETASLCCSTFAFLTALVFNDPNTSQAGRVVVSVLLIAFGAGVVAYLLMELSREVWRKVDDMLEEAKIGGVRDMSRMAKIWHVAALLAAQLPCFGLEEESENEAVEPVEGRG